eukprot:468556-Heterocapsa_arctica.AAC.1
MLYHLEFASRSWPKQCITGRGRLNAHGAMHEAATNAQWHNQNDQGQDTSNPPSSRHVTILVATMDLGTRIVQATMEYFPQDIIDKFNHHWVINRVIFKQ